MLADDVPVAYFSCPTDEHDVELFKFERGGSEGQQVCEALAMLVGLRLWSEAWKDGRLEFWKDGTPENRHPGNLEP